MAFMSRLPLLAALLAAGCAKTASNPDSPYTTLTERTTEDGIRIVEVDLDGDKRAEIYNHYRDRTSGSPLLVRKEVDLNRDGAVDVISYFDDAGALEREEMDSDFDGHFDWIDHYRDGARVMAETDTDMDGRSNVYAYYVDGKIQRKERDSDSDGRIDVWERFGADGTVTRTGSDTDGDGRIDVRTE
jgi:hypothetical protein